MPQKTEDTPMMKQYKEIRAQYPEAFLFYRLGDFYELFYEDAVEVANLLELTLTSRNKKADDPIPMCGVPYHAAEGYIDRLVDMGYKVAICEQVEDPKQTKGMVKREVVQVVTPGTRIGEKGLASDENNYLAALLAIDKTYYLAYTDLSTGELRATSLDNLDGLVNELATIRAQELLVEEEDSDLTRYLDRHLSLVYSKPRSEELDPSFDALLNTAPNLQIKTVSQYLLTYLKDTQMRSLGHIQDLEVYEADQYLRMGPGARKNLELYESLRDGSKKGTLYWFLNETQTAMGARLLKQWLDKPLIEKAKIKKRLDLVGNLLQHFFERVDLVDRLNQVYDLERLAGRVAFQTVNARDLIQLKSSLQQIPAIIQIIQSMNSDGVWDGVLDGLDPVQEVADLIEEAIVDEPPISVTEGDIIKDGYHDQLDQYRDALSNGKRWLAELETREREETGIKNLKVGFNKVFGYYIEISKANLKFLEEGRYERKQTLTNAERFITPELKEKEALILEAEEKSQLLEYEIFIQIREEVKTHIDRLQKLAAKVSEIDIYQAFARVSEENGLNRPSFHTDSQSVTIENGRHPVVEKVMGDQTYIPNDVYMDDETDILLITGPNMSGKSTYMRQLALTVIMAQMGCFVPAESADLPVFDQIFTRIGAMDDLIGGQSTFMVEMNEANVALQSATSRSLLLFDEIGRGTATFDGMALAEAIIEYIHDDIQAKTLFSTHYHELTDLEERLPALKNVHVGAVEDEGNLIFLHKMEEGPADKSYGVQVAKLAGLPDSLIDRASDILVELEAKQASNQASVVQDHQETSSETKTKQADSRDLDQVQEAQQLTLFEPAFSEEEAEVLDELKKINILSVTPIEAISLLNELQNKLK